MEQQPHHACERTKSKQKQNQVTSHSSLSRVLLFDLAHKQCNGIIKGWLHCLTSESNGRFLVNNILIFGSVWCLVMVQIQSFNKKIKIGGPENNKNTDQILTITLWLHCLTSESNGRFLVNNILIFGSLWCLVMAQIHFSLIKKNKKIWRPEHSLTPSPLRPITSHFCLNQPPLPPPPKVGVICVSTLLIRAMLNTDLVLNISL